MKGSVRSCGGWASDGRDLEGFVVMMMRRRDGIWISMRIRDVIGTLQQGT